MSRIVVALAVLAGVVALSAGRVEAFPGADCHHSRDCSQGEVCVADAPSADYGHCVRIKVLP